MSVKTMKIPDSDVTARKRTGAGEDPGMDTDKLDGLQTSNKTGKHSSVQKLAASRPEFGDAPGAHPKDGAFGDPSPKTGKEHPAGSPGSKGLNGRSIQVSNKVRKTKGDR
jgi:hypothetical protein